jgi:hypothetical protein
VERQFIAAMHEAVSEECRPFDDSRQDRGQPVTYRRPPFGADAAHVVARGHCGAVVRSAGMTPSFGASAHRLEHPDEPRHSGNHDRLGTGGGRMRPMSGRTSRNLQACPASETRSCCSSTAGLSWRTRGRSLELAW